MKSAFIKLYISIALGCFTGIFGKLINLNEGMLVWYRMLITVLILFILIQFQSSEKSLINKEKIWLSFIGFVLAVHWIFFYGSVKASNVSLAVVCFSLTGFFSALLEPFSTKKKISLREVSFSLLAVLGIAMIFHFDSRYRAGIFLGVISSILAAVYSILNKDVSRKYSLITLLYYEIGGGFLLLTLFSPIYFLLTNSSFQVPAGLDVFWLICFALFCTVVMYMLQVDALRDISAFTLCLSYNLEPVFTIILASLIFSEHQELGYSFFIGLILIATSVLLQMVNIYRLTSKNNLLTKQY